MVMLWLWVIWNHYVLPPPQQPQPVLRCFTCFTITVLPLFYHILSHIYICICICICILCMYVYIYIYVYMYLLYVHILRALRNFRMALKWKNPQLSIRFGHRFVF